MDYITSIKLKVGDNTFFTPLETAIIMLAFLKSICDRYFNKYLSINRFAFFLTETKSDLAPITTFVF